MLVDGKSSASAEPLLRGAIDSLEGAWAIVVLDDGQRIDWPRERLPAGAGPGAVVVLNLETGDLSAAGVDGVWEGIVGLKIELEGVLDVRLGNQFLTWPAVHAVAEGQSPSEERALSMGQAVAVRMQVDADDTGRRRKQVQSLVDDLFG
ncbi:MAG: DUF3006 domain-containing protein [Anaerolineae bacterium]|nr:DUF3006 domain-containing protein [Anaerolineae bacterium]